MIEEVGAVERRNGNQIEKAQHKIELDAKPYHALRSFEQSHHAGKGSGRKTDEDEDERPDEGENEICGDTCCRDKDVAPPKISELAAVDRYRLSAAEGELPVGDEPEERRHDNAHHRIDVRQRIEGDAPEGVGGIVALVQGDG